MKRNGRKPTIDVGEVKRQIVKCMGSVENPVWFSDSPDAGDPDCLCSLCGEPIAEGETPIRRYDHKSGEEVREARFHVVPCFQKVFRFETEMVIAKRALREAFLAKVGGENDPD